MTDISRACYVYGLTDPLSGNVRYIGKGLDPRVRFKDHLNVKEPGVSHKDKWVLSLRRLGLTPEIIILETTTFGEANERERFWIAEYRSLGFNLTNQTAGGDGGSTPGRKLSEETKEKMRQAALGRVPTEEARVNMSRAARISQIGNTALLGYKHTDESKQKMSLAQKGNQYAKGHVHSPEARLKMSLAHKERYRKQRDKDSKR